MGIQPQSNPFPGLRAFFAEEDYLFFGREEQVNELLSRLRQHRFLSVLGASGSGKSSLVRAGMLPALEGGAMTSAGSYWEIGVMRPGGNPIQNLAKVLFEMDLYDYDKSEAIFHLQATLKRSGLGLVEAIKQSEIEEGANLLIVVDQFEELFRFSHSGQAQDEIAAAFVKLLLEASRQSDISIYVVITMRSDYIGDCAQFPDLTESVNESEYLVPRLKRDQRRTAIEGPIKVAGGEITSRLTQKLLNDFGNDPDQLPVLQHLLMRMWDKWVENRGPDDPLDLQHYENIGGMEGALSQHADEVFLESVDEEEKQATQKLFQALTEKGGDNRGIRRPTRLDELYDIVSAESDILKTVVERFRKPGRTFLMPPVEVSLEDDTVVDISHESLMRVWVNLRQWVETESQSARIFVRLAETAQLHADDKAGLYSDPDLQIALSWRDEAKPNEAWGCRYHTEYDRAIGFLNQSAEAKQRIEEKKEEVRQRELEQAKQLAAIETQRAEEQAKSARNLRKMVAAIGLVAVLAITATVIAIDSSRHAMENAIIAEDARKLAVKSQIETENEKQRFQEQLYSSQILSAASALQKGNFQRAEDVLWKTPESLRNWEWGYLLNQATIDILTLSGHEGGVNSACFSPDGMFVLTGSSDMTARLWGVPKGDELARLKGHQGAVTDVAFSHDGKRAITASEDYLARVWELPEGKKLFVLKGHKGTVNSASFSTDGRYIATVSNDSSSIIWDAKTGSLIKRFQDHSGNVNSVEFSPDNRQIITSSDDRTVVVRFIESDSNFRRFTGHESAVTHAKFTPSGEGFLSATENHKLRHWNITDDSFTSYQGQTLAKSFRGTGISPASVFDINPKNQEIVLASQSDRGFEVTDFFNRNNKEFSALKTSKQEILAHKSGIYDLSYSPDGRFILTASKDKTAKVWMLEPKAEAHPIAQRGDTYLSAQFVPDGNRIVTTTDNGITEIRSSTNLTVIHNIFAHKSSVFTAKFNNTGSRFLTASRDGTIKVWDSKSGVEQLKFIVDNPKNVWTKQPPKDWTIDDSGVPGVGDRQNDGVTEWAGWSFADKNWWVQVSGDQNRSRFTSGQGVIAVADSDEWDDKPHNIGKYSTFMKTPPISLKNIQVSEIEISFDSSWRPEGDQAANIVLLSNLDEKIKILQWESTLGSPNFKPHSPDERLNISVRIPENCKSFQLLFGYYNAMNNWYWAIDNLQIKHKSNLLFSEDFEGLKLEASVDEGSDFEVAFSPNGERVLATQKDAFIFDAHSGVELKRFKMWPEITKAGFTSDAAHVYAFNNANQTFNRQITFWDAGNYEKDQSFKFDYRTFGPLAVSPYAQKAYNFLGNKILDTDLKSLSSKQKVNLEDWLNVISEEDYVVFGNWENIKNFASRTFNDADSVSLSIEAVTDVQGFLNNQDLSVNEMVAWTNGSFLTIDGKYTTNYYLRKIKSNLKRSIYVDLGFSGAAKAWHNGQLVLEKKELEEEIATLKNIKLNLIKGDNYLVIKLVNAKEKENLYFDISNYLDDAAVLSNKDWQHNTNPGFALAYWRNVGPRWSFSDGIKKANYFPSKMNNISESWRHILITNDRAGDSVGYIDGAEVFRVDISKIGNVDTPLITAIGTDGLLGKNWPAWYNGSIDELGIWKRVLSANEIELLSKKHLPNEFSEHLRLHLQFENNTNDTSGNSLHGEAHGDPAFVNGVMGQAIRLDATRQQYVNLGESDKLNFSASENFSISIWLKSEKLKIGTITRDIEYILKQSEGKRNDMQNRQLIKHYSSIVTQKEIANLKMNNFTRVWDVQFSSPNGRLFLAGFHDGMATLWDTENGSIVQTYNSNAGPVRKVFFSPDTKRIITATQSESLNIWNTFNGTQVLSFNNFGSRAISLNFSPDGRKILATLENGSLRLWEAAPWKPEELPGDSSMSWEYRFNEWNKRWINRQWATQ